MADNERKDTGLFRPIAHIENDLDEKFGIPRQSGLVPSLTGKIVFEPEFRDPRAVRGLEEFSHIWLIWEFSEARREKWSPLVRPPKLGGNTYMGVFATRSPFRPNPLGLSCVRLERVQTGDKETGPVLYVSGADLMNGTPIYDIKPYLPYADSHPEASEGFLGRTNRNLLEVQISDELMNQIPSEKRDALIGILSQDPRPSYQNDPERVYGVSFAGFNVRFRVEENILSVQTITGPPH